MTDIIGPSTVPWGRLAAWARSLAPHPKVSDWETMAACYVWEGAIEGVTGDIAFCQMLHETGYLQFGGDVTPDQNNFAGIGTTGGGVKGASFPSVGIGIRAHIQHLHRYASTAPLKQAVVDPRQSAPPAGSRTTWEALDGHWAVPGVGYGELIVALRDSALAYGGADVELWVPYAIRKPLTYDTGKINIPVLGLVEHVTTNHFDPAGFFSNPSNQANSTLWIADDGTLEQYLALDRRSWAQAAGNSDYWSVETSGTPDQPLNEAQVATMARLFAYLKSHPFSGFGFTLAEAPGQRGLGWHGMGGAAWGGHTGCPGDLRRQQRPRILALASGQPGPPPGPPLPPAPGGTVAVNVPVIKQGDKNHAVLVVQTLLHGAGFDVGPLDGDFGPKTAGAIKFFQGATGLAADGVVGESTWGKILAG